VTFPRHAEVFEVVDVVVDSGAVISIFSKSFCDLIGLSFEEGRGASVRTATGEEIRIRIHRVKMRIGDCGLDVRVAFSESGNILYVLGRLDILDKVEMRFERRNKVPDTAESLTLGFFFFYTRRRIYSQ